MSVSDGHRRAITNGTYSIKLSPGTYTVTGPIRLPTAPFSPVVTHRRRDDDRQLLYHRALLNLRSSFAVSGGNGNGVIDRNECFKVYTVLGNVGCLTETGIAATSHFRPRECHNQALSTHPTWHQCERGQPDAIRGPHLPELRVRDADRLHADGTI